MLFGSIVLSSGLRDAWAGSSKLGSRVRHRMATSLLLLLLAWLQLCASQTAYVMPFLDQDIPSNHTYMRLGNIMTNPAVLKQYDRILLASDVRLKPQLYPLVEPVALARNLTIASANYSRVGYRLLELEFATNRLLIPQGLSLTLKDLALGRARKTSGQGLPFFVGEGERSLLILDNVIRIRTACAHNEPELVAALQSIAWRRGTGNGTRQQEVELVPVYAFRGKLFDDNIHAINLRYFVGPVDVPDTTYYAGYTMKQINTTRICETYVSDECVTKKGADVCVMDQIDALTHLAESPPPKPSSADDTNMAAIVAPSVIGGTLLVVATLVGVFMLHRRRNRRAQDRRSSLLPVTAKSGLTSSSASGGGGGPLLGPQSPGSPPALANPTLLPGPFSGAMGSIEDLAIGSRAGSWQLAAFHTAPEFQDATPDDKLRLGVLLGAGSFGRVYRGLWWPGTRHRQLDVAVKVLQHDSTTAAAIANEVNLVMSFRHPSIVAAFYFVTWKRVNVPEDAASNVAGNPAAHSAPAGTSTAPRSQPLLLLGGLPSTSHALEPVAEAASSSTTRHSSTQHSGAAVTSAGNKQGGSKNSNDSNAPGSGHASGERQQRQQQAGATTSKGCFITPVSGACVGAGASDSSSTSTMLPVSKASDISAAFRSTRSNSSSCHVGVPDFDALGAGLCQQVGSNSSSSVDSTAWVAAQGALQQQGQMPAFVPMLHPQCSASGRSSDISKQAQVLTSPQERVKGTGQSVWCVVPCSTELPRAVGLEPQAMSQAARVPIAYEVSTGGTNRSPSNPRDVSSSAAGTSSSFIAAAYGSGQQSRPTASRQSDGTASSDQQHSSVSSDKPDCRYPQQQQQQQQPSIMRVMTPPDCSSHTGQQRPLILPGANGTPTSGGKSAARPRNADEAQTWLIFEHCDGGTLLDLLADGTLGPRGTGAGRLVQVLTLLLDIASGMSYLHSRNVLHGDLKPCNVLIKAVQGAPYGRVAKVSDFGLSRALQAGQSHRSTRTFGTLNHTPPELLRLGRLSPAGDVYAFGIMMWEAYTGQVAFSGLHYGEVFEQVALLQRRPDIPADMPADYAELVTQCWAADPLVRPPFTAVWQQLDDMLSSFMQDEVEAQERFISDL